MTEDLLSLQKEILALPVKDNLKCFLVYGSILTDSKANDFDAIVIVEKVDSALNGLFKIISNRYNKLDINIYTYAEILENISFLTREFKLEYLSKGVCLYGENILKNEYWKINDYKYKQSMFIRSIERLQMVRQKYFLSSTDPEEKLNYLKKYFFRISKSLLILNGVEKDSTVQILNQDKVNQKLFDIGMFDFLPNTEETKTVDEYFDLFNLIGKALIKCKKDLDLH